MFFLLLVLLLVLVFNEIFSFYKPNGEVKTIEISKGTSLVGISKVLKKKGVVNSFFLFSAYARLVGAKLKYGVFSLNSEMSYDEIIRILSDESRNEVCFTQLNIFEGSNMFNLKKRYFNEKNFDITEIIKKINDEEIYGKFKFAKILKKEQLKSVYYPMEGFCAIDSFNVKRGYDSETVANLVLSEFDEIFNKFKEDIDNNEFDFWQIMTMASVIQAEVNNYDDMPKVASVLYNRLTRGKRRCSSRRLECDSTRNYSRKIKSEMKKSMNVDLKLVDSYDTYKCFGLPAGPICNPGVSAIKAALNPAKTDYFYFCVDLDDGKVFFAKTYKEHNENLKKAHLV